MIWQQVVVLCALGSTGLVLILRPLLKTEPRLDAALDRMYGAGTATQAEEAGQKTQTTTKIGGWLALRLPPALAPNAADLAITDSDRAEHVGKKALFALGGLVIMPLIAASFTVLGIALPIPVTGLTSLLLGALGFFLPDLILRTMAKTARLDAARAAVAYLLLSSITRASGAGIAVTLYSTATAFNTPAYLNLRAVLERARWTSSSPWEALQEEGRRTGVPETTEVGDIMRLAGESDAAIIETLRARSKSLRESLLSREIAQEKSRTSQLAVPIALLAIVFIIGALYPPLMRIVGA